VLSAVPDAEVLFIPDPDDEPEIEALEAAGANWIAVDGNYAQKINTGVEQTNTEYVLTGADDLHFHPGWFEAAKAKMSDTIGCVGTQDLCNPRVIRGEHATHFLMARWYAELGTIDGLRGPLCELWLHEWCDDECIGTARKRNAYAFANDAVVEHLHPMAGKAPTDALYDAQGERMAHDRPLFRKRRVLWT